MAVLCALKYAQELLTSGAAAEGPSSGDTALVHTLVARDELLDLRLTALQEEVGELRRKLDGGRKDEAVTRVTPKVSHRLSLSELARRLRGGK
jgi:hypothetical protein